MAKVNEKRTQQETTAVSEPKAKTLRIRQIRSTISTKPGHAESVRGLGLRRIRDVVERPDDSAVRGVLAKVGYLLEVEEVER